MNSENDINLSIPKRRKILTLDNINSIKSMLEQGASTKVIARTFESSVSNINKVKAKLFECNKETIPIQLIFRKCGRKKSEALSALHTEILSTIQEDNSL